MRKYVLPLLFIFLFILESMFVQAFGIMWLEKELVIVPRFLYISLLFFAIYSGGKQGLIYCAIFGLLFDVVYTEIIGIYLFLFPMLAYLVLKLMKILQLNVVVITVIVNIAVVALEIAIYYINFLLNITDIEFSAFWNVRLLPTIIFNLIFTALFAYPFKKLFAKTDKEVDS